MQISIIMRSKLNIESRIDAEYYSPKKINTDTIVKSRPHTLLGKLCKLISGPFGSTVTVDRYVKEPEFRYIRGKDVQSFFIDNSDPKYISRELFYELSKYHLQDSDILVTVVGMDFGKAAVIFSDEGELIFSCKSSLIRDVKINSLFLVSFLSCKYGHLLVRRGQRGAAQPGINLLDLREIPVPTISRGLQNSIASYVLRARNKLQNSKMIYFQSEQLLLSELGLQNWIPTHTLTYIQNFNRIAQNKRLDAEYFQPKFRTMFDTLNSNVHLDYLGKITNLVKGIEVGSSAYEESGIPFWRVSNLTKSGLDENNLNYINENLYDSLRSDFEPQQGELLLSKDATPGLAYYLENPLEGIISSGILRLIFINDMPPTISNLF